MGDRKLKDTDFINCPYCGASRELDMIENDSIGDDVWQVVCWVCNSRGPEKSTVQEALGAYNLVASIIMSVRSLAHSYIQHDGVIVNKWVIKS